MAKFNVWIAPNSMDLISIEPNSNCVLLQGVQREAIDYLLDFAEGVENVAIAVCKESDK